MHVGWRPAFKFYNKWVALFGAAVCVAIMFVIRWYYALVTFVIVLILYKIVDFLKPGEYNCTYAFSNKSVKLSSVLHKHMVMHKFTCS